MGGSLGSAAPVSALPFRVRRAGRGPGDEHAGALAAALLLLLLLPRSANVTGGAIVVVVGGGGAVAGGVVEQRVGRWRQHRSPLRHMGRHGETLRDSNQISLAVSVVNWSR